MIRFCSSVLCVVLWLASPAVADVDFSGPVRVIDGDTLDVGQTRVRLHGIDAPEVGQPCSSDRLGVYDCGAFVRDELARRYAGKTASCELIELDRYGRSVAKCFVGGQDIGEDIVLDGLATAYRTYSMDYDLAEKSAQVAETGLWSGIMQSPAAYRADQRAPTPDVIPDGTCIIKGNISGSGQIYHMPHNRDYANTRINEARGERWFCTEAEARAAGWRAARN